VRLEARTAWPAAAVAAMVLAFVAYAAAQPDPSLAAGAFHPGDRRAHRYGTMEYAQVAQLVEQLRAQRSAASDPAEQAVLSVKLGDVYVARQMLPEALAELTEARRLAPDEPEVLWRLALVQHYLGHDAEADAALAAAEARAPRDPRVLRAAEQIQGEP
jgi:Flp pilus assembly protein TadD